MIRARDRVFQTGSAAADELAGVDVDRNQRFGLIDDRSSHPTSTRREV